MSRAKVITPDNFQLRLVGHYLEPVLKAAERAGILPLVTLEPPVPYLESLRLQRGATALLFFDWFDGQEKGWYSAKIYEYLGAGRPILSIGPSSTAAARLIDSTGAGIAAESPSQARDVLERWLRQHQTSGTLRSGINPTTIAQYHRQAAALQMARVLNQYAQ